MTHIRWCGCDRRILKIKYILENKPCELCQEEDSNMKDKDKDEDNEKEFNG